ncbi:MAG: TolC family protein [Bacteroidota bacterium]
MKKIFKRTFLLCALLFNAQLAAYSQLSIETCQEKARANYPLVKQYGLVEQSEHYSISNANKGYLPQLAIMAKATYQSDVTEIPIKLPFITIPSMSKDQYQAVAELNQSIWDGGMIQAQKKNTRAATEVDKRKTEVDLYALNERVNQLFFGLLLLNEQLKQNELLQKELQTNLDRLTSFKDNGVANDADLDAIKVEQLKTKQRKIDLLATQSAYKDMLALMMGVEINDATVLQKPDIQKAETKTQSNNRPELSLFAAQSNLYLSQKSVITSGNLPKLGFYVQGGYGKPGLNMLKDEFTTFYIGGFKLSWSLGGFYSMKNNFRKIDINQKMVDVQKETFLFNSKLKVSQQQNEMDKIKAILNEDNEIITLRNNIKKAAEVKVDNGILSVSDLIREINAANLAIQDKSLHEIQLLMAWYNLKYTLNN